MNAVFFTQQGVFRACGIYEEEATCLAERFPTEVRAGATGFFYHQGAAF